MLENVEATIRSLTRNAEVIIWDELEKIEAVAGNYSAFLFNRTFENRELLRRMLDNLVQTDSLIAGASLLVRSEEGPLLLEYQKGSAAFFVREDLQYIKLKSESYRPDAWSGPHFDPLYKEQVVSYEQRVYRMDKDQPAEAAGIVVDIPLQWINQIINNIRVYDSGEVFLVSGDGTFITHPNPKSAGQRNIRDLLTEVNSEKVSSIIDSIFAGAGGYAELQPEDLFEEEGLITYQPLFDTGWSIIITFRKAEYMASVYRETRRLIMIGTISLLLLALLIFGIIRWLTNPLVQLTRLTERIRQGQFNTSLPEKTTGVEAMQFSETIRSLQTELGRYIDNLTATISEKEKIESDIRIASDIQAELIPDSFPDPDTINGFDIYGKILPARWVSGDLFDILRLDEDHLCFVIGDVTGKGVPASLFMAITRTLVHTESRRIREPAGIAEAVNDQLSERNPSSVFVTLFLGILELSTGTLEYCNAGHLYPFVLDHGSGIRLLDQNHGLPLGLYAGKKYRSDSIKLLKNSALFLYSDGIIEAENSEGEFFGAERLKELLERIAQRKMDSKILVWDVFKYLERFIEGESQIDDMTLLVLART